MEKEKLTNSDNNRRFLSLDLGTSITGVAFADGNLYKKGFMGSPLVAIKMPNTHRKFCELVKKIILNLRVNVLVLGLPLPVKEETIQSKQNRRKIMALSNRLKKFFLQSSGEIKNELVSFFPMGLNIVFYNEAYSTYAVRSLAKLKQYSKKQAITSNFYKEEITEKNGKIFTREQKHSDSLRPNVNLDSLAALEILSGYLNAKA